jgi:hypothetical protein
MWLLDSGGTAAAECCRWVAVLKFIGERGFSSALLNTSEPMHEAML